MAAKKELFHGYTFKKTCPRVFFVLDLWYGASLLAFSARSPAPEEEEMEPPGGRKKERAIGGVIFSDVWNLDMGVSKIGVPENDPFDRVFQ